MYVENLERDNSPKGVLFIKVSGQTEQVIRCGSKVSVFFIENLTHFLIR